MVLAWNRLFSDRAQTITGSQIRNFFKLTEKPEMISFAGGFPCENGFPRKEIKTALQELMEEERISSLQYGPTEGIEELRQYLSVKMAREGITSSPDEIVVVNGSQQGLDLVFRLLLNPFDLVLVEEPGYVGGLGAIQTYQGKRIGIPVSSEGIDLDFLEKTLNRLSLQGKRVKFIYVIPNFQNPTGSLMPLASRKHLLSLAGRYDFLIIEDNPYGELRYEGEMIPSLKSLDEEGRVIYLGSFSKILIPGVRIGWIVAHPSLIEKVILAKQVTDLCSNTLGQKLVCHLAQNEYLVHHVNDLIAYYRRKRDIMLSSMERYFPPEISFTRPRGGFFTWVSFPSSFPPAEELLEMALAKSVAFVPGQGFYSERIDKNTARFSFSQPAAGKIEEGVKRLGDLFYQVQKSSRCALGGI